METEAISQILQVYLMQSLNNQDGVSKPSTSVSFENVLNSAMQGYSSQKDDNNDFSEILLKMLPLYLLQGLSSGGSDGLSSSTSSSALFESLLKSTIDGYGLQSSNENLNTNVKSYENVNSSNEKLSDNIEDAIEKVSKKYGVDADFIRAIIKQESGFKPNAVSKSGAMGLMQLMPKTAEALGVDNPFNALENLDGGTRYIKKLMESFEGNPVLALAAYNGGSGRMRRLGVDSVEEIQLMPKETRNYVQKVMNNYEKYKRL